MNIFLFLYSDLTASGGGRETWLSAFLAKASERLKSDGMASSVPKFTVFYWRKAPIDPMDDLLATLPDDCATYINLHPRTGSIHGSLRSSATYTFAALRYFFRLKPARSHTIVISLGFVPEGFPAAVLFLFGYKHFAWLRSIYAKILHHDKPRWKRAILNLVALTPVRLAQDVISNGQDTADHYKIHHGIKSHVIPNALDDVPAYRPPLPEEGSMRVGLVCRLSPERGVKEFLDAAEKARAQGSRLKFHVVGKGPMLNEVLEAQRSGTVRYDGHMPRGDVLSYLTTLRAQCQLVGFGDRGGSGLSNGLLEGLAQSVPQIAWRNPVYTQVLNDENAFLVEENNVEELAQTFLRVEQLKDFSTLSRAAHSTAKRFDMDAHYDKFYALAAKAIGYRHLLDRRREPNPCETDHLRREE